MRTYIRKATISDLDAIEAIITNARLFLKSRGLPQWQNGYGPGRIEVQRDIQKQEGYAFIVGEQMCGYAALTAGTDEYYARIAGRWDERHPRYLSIHRVAFDAAIRGQGLSAALFNALLAAAREAGWRDIRIDTHPRNEIMEKVILRAGFTYCGMIQLPMPDGERKAYQLLMDHIDGH